MAKVFLKIIFKNTEMRFIIQMINLTQFLGQTSGVLPDLPLAEMDSVRSQCDIFSVNMFAQLPSTRLV